MPVQLYDRIKEITSSTGTGPLLLDGGPAIGYRGFNGVVPSTQPVPYVITHGIHWEIGTGFFDEPTNSFERTSVSSSTNNNQLVDFDVGNKYIFIASTSSVFEDMINQATNIDGGFAN